MQAHSQPSFNTRIARWWPAVLAALLAACGGGSEPVAPAATEIEGAVATASTTLELDAEALPATDADRVAEPAFHVAPVLLAEPDDTDELQPGASASRGPHKQAVPAANAGLSTRRLTADRLLAAQRMQRLSGSREGADGSASPAAGTGAVTTYTPAQVRAAYGLPALPAVGTVFTAAQAAQFGAGQTIYVIGARHNPNVSAELAAFNQKFGLPTCTTKAVAASAALPLAAPAARACELSVVYTTAGGSRTATAPTYDADWATEVALDVQWAHAIAPLARIVLIEAPDPSVNSLLGAIRLAGAMGPGAVSMSFGAGEAGFTEQVDSAFTSPGMTYLAATGDWGTGVMWPSVSSRVLAVGGTTLSWSGSGARSETVWSGTGGGMSASTPRPTYQTAAVPGLGTPARRTLADVAFNADPSSGQYVAVMASGSTTVNWISAGGTSLSTPQWAGLVAVANALRAQAAKPVLGAPHAVLYEQIGAVPGTYAGAFADIVQGSNGSCTLCSAQPGYDTPTGLGTPQAAALLAALGGATAAPVVPVAPVVTSATISGKVGTALSYTVVAQSANALTWSLAGAPAGMTIAAGGKLSWARPVAGVYTVKVTARDSKTGLTGQGTCTVQIVTAAGLSITAAPISGKAGQALSGSVVVAAPGASSVSITISGAPLGMTFTPSGLSLRIGWASPVRGSYSLKVAVKDSLGRTANATVPVTVAP